MTSSPKHALVTGASGISGWGALKELLAYPNSTTFASITGLTNRPLTLEQAHLPSDPRLQLVNGIDLTLPASEVIDLVKLKVPNIEDVTHAYLYAYIDTSPDLLKRTEVNGKIVDNCLIVHKTLSPRLEHVILQTGTKTYGIEFPYQITLPPLPWKESLPRVQNPEIVPQMFYYRQLDILAKHAEGASWKWSEVRPDIIVGFAPTMGPMHLGVPLGSTSPSGNASMVSALPYRSQPAGREDTRTGVNVASPAMAFPEKWPLWAKAFGLVGVGPASEDIVNVEEWCLEHKETWLEMEKEYGLKKNTLETAGWAYMRPAGLFDREFDLTKMRETGFIDETDPIAAWEEAWSMMVQDKLLPPLLRDA